MPVYEYRCGACGHRFERMRKISAPLVKKCPKCGKNEVEKLISRSAVKFEGTGWYVTDYARQKAPPADGGEKGKPAAESGETKSKKETPAKESSKAEKS